MRGRFPGKTKIEGFLDVSGRFWKKNRKGEVEETCVIRAPLATGLVNEASWLRDLVRSRGSLDSPRLPATKLKSGTQKRKDLNRPPKTIKNKHQSYSYRLILHSDVQLFLSKIQNPPFNPFHRRATATPMSIDAAPASTTPLALPALPALPVAMDGALAREVPTTNLMTWMTWLIQASRSYIPTMAMIGNVNHIMIQIRFRTVVPGNPGIFVSLRRNVKRR